MNDDFLHRLREAPPPAFAAQLKARLDTLPSHTAPARRSATLRALFAGILIGGAAVAVTAISIRGLPPAIEEWLAPDPSPQAAEAIRLVLPTREVLPDGSVSRQRSSPTTAGERTTEQERTPLPSHPSRSAERSSVFAPAGGPAPARQGIAGVRGPVFDVAVSHAAQPLAQLIAGDLDTNPQSRAVKLHSGDDAFAFGMFCEELFAAVAITSRRMRPQEWSSCHRWGRNRGLYELTLGTQAIVLAQNQVGTPLKLSRRDIFLALARRTPVSAEPTRVVSNPATMWHQVVPNQNFQTIQVLGPPADSFLRPVLLDLLFEPGCLTYPQLAATQEPRRKVIDSVCRALRSDGIYIDETRDLKVVAQSVRAMPGAVGVFDYTFFDTNREGLVPIEIDGVAPTTETIATGKYPGSRTFYLYVNDETLRNESSVAMFFRLFREATSPRGRFVELGVAPPAGDPQLHLRQITRIEDLQ